MAFEPENPLEEALDRAVTDPLARPAFYRLLMESPLHVLGRGGEGQELSIPTLRHNGREFLPIFSAASRLAAFAGEREHFVMAARPLFETTRGANFVLNPNADRGKMLLAMEIAYWLDPSARSRRKLRDAAIRLAPPAEKPGKLIDALTILFRHRANIVSAHLLEATSLDNSEPPHPLIGIETTGDWPKVSREVSELAAAIVPDVILDVVAIDPSLPPDSLSGRLARAPAFYTAPSN